MLGTLVTPWVQTLGAAGDVTGTSEGVGLRVEPSLPQQVGKASALGHVSDVAAAIFCGESPAPSIYSFLVMALYHTCQ